MRALALGLASLLLIGCGADDPTDGDATLSFGVTNGVRSNPTLEDALIGDVYGNIFLQEEVTVTGPVDGATEFGSVEVLDVDLEAGTESPPWTSPRLAPGSYIFLGFFDVDANGAETREPDNGDPVTLPVTNVFEITAGETVTLDAVFDLVLN